MDSFGTVVSQVITTVTRMSKVKRLCEGPSKLTNFRLHTKSSKVFDSVLNQLKSLHFTKSKVVSGTWVVSVLYRG